jgi:serine/threonine protein phosphatase PrpC
MQNHEQSTTKLDEPLIEVAVATLAGDRARNADAHLVDQAAGFFAVADGMQDLPRSREVALAALRTVDETLQAPWVLLPHAERTTEEAGERLLHGIARAHVQLFEPNAPPKARIGTTFAGLVVCRGGRIVMAHVGSSRVYLLRRERRVLERLTQDRARDCGGCDDATAVLVRRVS